MGRAVHGQCASANGPLKCSEFGKAWAAEESSSRVLQKPRCTTLGQGTPSRPQADQFFLGSAWFALLHKQAHSFAQRSSSSFISSAVCLACPVRLTAPPHLSSRALFKTGCRGSMEDCASQLQPVELTSTTVYNAKLMKNI